MIVEQPVFRPRVQAGLVIVPLTVDALGPIISSIGKALSEYDEMALDLLRAGDRPEDIGHAVRVMLHADLLDVELAFPAGAFIRGLDRIHPDYGPTFRLCSSCGSLSPDTSQHPTTCGPCREKEH